MKLRHVAGVLLVLASLRADESTQSERRLLDLAVVALDERGQAVTNLTADDFQITDSGKPQKISFFRRNSGSTDLESAPALPFSNRANGDPPHATVILFDLLNEGFPTRGVAANQMIRALEPLESADSLYLYLLTVDAKLLPVRGLPGSEEGLRSAPRGLPWTRQIKPILDDAMRVAQRIRTPDIDVFVRTQLTYAALDRMGVELSAVPGRKNLVWVTEGVPIGLGMRRSDTGQDIDFTPQIRRLSESLDRYGIAIYPVRQIMLGRPDDIGSSSGVGQTGGAGTGVESIDTLDEFADLTGGRRSTDKDIGGAVKQAMTDLRFNYQIGYYPPANNWDGKFHKLRVTSKRKGVRIQTKTGYFAWTLPVGSRAQDAFAATAATAFDAAEIGLGATVSPDPQNSRAAHVAVRVDARDVVLAQDGDHYTGQLRIITVGYLPDGRAESGSVIPLDVNFSSDERQKAFQNGISFSESIAAEHNESKFRVIVFDRGSNAVGSITIPVTALPQAGH